MRVEWCVRNERFGTGAVMKKWLHESSSDTDIVQRYACIDLCEVCARQPFVLVDHRQQSATSSRQLSEELTRLKQQSDE